MQFAFNDNHPRTQATCLPIGRLNLEPLATPINDAARALGIGRSTVYKLIAEQKLQTIKIGGRRLVKADSIRALVAA